jgi:GTP pyrophosphokinase
MPRDLPTPLKGRIKDYISQPKPNGYRSLHTTVFCEDGEIVEFQIRTKEMHENAELGIAAHWSYDERKQTALGKGTDTTNIDWVSQLADIQQDIADKKQYMKAFDEVKIDVFKDRIFVFTPQGDVIDLPETATPIDFAYHIHSELGAHTVGVLVNQHMSSLDRPLRSGDVVEIIKDKNRKRPSEDWLTIAVTTTAREKIRAQLKKNSPSTNWNYLN